MYNFYMISMPLVRLGVSGLLGGWIFFYTALMSPSWILKAPSLIRGEWADQAFSDILSQRYDARVRVTGVRMPSWTEIHFDALRVDSREGERLLRSGSGHLRLRRIEWSRQPLFVTELIVEELDLMREYYRRALPVHPWGSLLKKPLRLDEIRLQIHQRPKQTRVEVRDCQADGIQIQGAWVLGHSEAPGEGLKVKLSPWLILKTAI